MSLLYECLSLSNPNDNIFCVVHLVLVALCEFSKSLQIREVPDMC